jgi:multiple sugar transport system substrate-binding protein
MTLGVKRRNKMAAAGVAALTIAMALTSTAALAQVEVAYATFLDPTNSTDPRAAAQTRMIEQFEAQNPDIKIELFIDSAGANVARNIKSGLDSPDVWRATTFQVPEFVATGNAEPLDEYIERDGIDKNDWLIPLEAAKIDGHIYGMYQDFRIPLLMYRKQMIADAGVNLPTTWDEVCTEGAKLNKGPVIGYALPVGGTGGVGGAQALAEFAISTMLTDESGQYFESDYLTPAFDRAALIRALTQINDLYTTCNATNKTSLSLGYNELHDALRAGTIGMATFGLYRYRAIQAGGAGDDLGWAPAPGFTADEKLTLYGFQLMLNKNSPNKDAAWKFISFMTGAEAQSIAAEAGEVVARKSAYDAPYFQTPEGADQLKWASMIEERGVLPRYSKISSTFNIILGDVVQKMVLSDGFTPEKAADEILEKYKAAAAEAQ